MVGFFCQYENEFKLNNYKKLKLIVEWDVLCDYQPKKYVYYGRTCQKNIWHSSANDLVCILSRELVDSVVILINEHDPKKIEKIKKYEQTFGKFPQVELGVYSDRAKWIKQNASNFDIFVGFDDRLKHEKGFFSRRHYLIPENSLGSGWNVTKFDNNQCDIPEAGGLTDQDIVTVAKDMQDSWDYFNKSYDKSKKTELKKSTSNSKEKLTQQPIKEAGSSGSSFNPSGFFWGVIATLSVGLVIWFLLKRNRERGAF